MTPEIRHLLGGYATGTLTEAERAKLFAAALEDQTLFDALAEEQSLKELLDDPEARGYLLAELDQLEQQATLQPEASAAPSRPMAQAAPERMLMSRKAAPRPVPVQPPPPTTPMRFWLPFSAVMLALLVTGWFWWRHQPEPLQQVAVSQAPAVVPPAPSQKAAELLKEAEADAPGRPASAAKRSAAPAAAPVPAAPVPAATQPLRDEAPKSIASADNAVKREAAPERAELKAAAEAAPPPATAAAPAAPARVLGSVAAPGYRLLRLQDGQYIPTPANARFRAGDTVVFVLPLEPRPRLSLGDGPPIPLQRDADGYRSAAIELPAGVQEFVVVPDTAVARSRSLADRESRQAKAAPQPAPLRIRLNVE